MNHGKVKLNKSGKNEFFNKKIMVTRQIYRLHNKKTAPNYLQNMKMNISIKMHTFKSYVSLIFSPCILYRTIVSDYIYPNDRNLPRVQMFLICLIPKTEFERYEHPFLYVFQNTLYMLKCPD